jgi:peptidoglycan/xylan/chitin deacetylase (PgdA/CDA1 family)
MTTRMRAGFCVLLFVLMPPAAGCKAAPMLNEQESGQSASVRVQPAPRAGARLVVIDKDTGLQLGATPVSIGDRYLMTGPDGTIELDGLRVGLTAIAARAEGYFLYRETHQLAPGPNSITVGLRPESDPVSATLGGRVAYLTIDDGPHRRWTPSVLDILEGEAVQATFFIVGKRAERRPDLVRRIYLEGHAVANHTYSHDYSQLYGGGVANYLSSLADNERSLKGMIGYASRLTRPPGGAAGNFGFGWQAAVNAAGYTTVLWNVSTGDGAPETTSSQMVEHAARYIEGLAPSQPAIVLMHDVRPAIVGALPEIIAELKRRGFEFAVLDEATPPQAGLIIR